jgi:nucleotide-binding universal stress UspA family protein
VQPLSRILLPVDFSERSAPAAHCARSLARQFSAEVLAAHILTPPQYEFGALEITGAMLEGLYQARAEQAEGRMQAFLAAELAGLNAQGRVLEGEPSQVIVRLSHEEHTDLIIMPTHGYGQFRRFILGSNTAKVLHDADCPVLTGVHMEQPPALPERRFLNILCALDLGAQSAKALRWAAMLAGTCGASLTVMHAVSAPQEANGEPGFGPGVREAARAELERLARSLNVEAELFVEAGEAVAVICASATRLAADALVIGRGSAAGVFGRLRTNAYAIIRQSPCPVISV